LKRNITHDATHERQKTNIKKLTAQLTATERPAYLFIYTHTNCWKQRDRHQAYEK